MNFDPNGVGRLNLFALVIYIPDSLGKFLDDLRIELVPGCNPRAHVSVLPPRSIAGSPNCACEEIRALAADFPPFDVEVTELAVFRKSSVVYLEIGKGFEQIEEMHRRMSAGLLTFSEPFEYHPHITLAQEFPPADVARLYELAARRWREYQGPRSFRAERAVFVQNCRNNCWIDLAELSLGGVRVG